MNTFPSPHQRFGTGTPLARPRARAGHGKAVALPWGLALGLVATVASAQPLPALSFAVDAEPGFKPVRPALRAYLDAQPTPPPRGRSAQQFCAVGYRQGDSRHAWVYWHQGQRLVYWEPAADDVESKETLTRSRRDLNLRRDVVATTAELRGSSYRIDRPWLARLLADCRRRGQAYTLDAR